MHIPAERLRLHTPTDDDLRLAKIMAAEGVDFLAVSFVRAAADLVKVREAVAPYRPHLVAKIETLPAVAALEEIAAEADAVMVARGDLGIECPLEDVPHLQKRIVRHCVEMGVPVITATQMLESMITSPSPTRAEVSDIANAVFDGTDALMLSAETAIGHDPVARGRVDAAHRRAGGDGGQLQRVGHAPRAHAAARSGPTVPTGSRWRSPMPPASPRSMRAPTRSCAAPGRVAPPGRWPGSGRPRRSSGCRPTRRPCARWRCRGASTPMVVDTYTSTDELVWFAVESAVKAGHVQRGQVVLVLAGAPDRPSGAATDVLRLVQVS